MGYLEPTETIEIVEGTNPDTVAPSVRRFRLSPLRRRDVSVDPDFTEDGLDLYIHGDPDADADTLTVYTGIPDDRRNGLKRSYTESGLPAVWAEPSPQTYDSAGSSPGILGTATGPPASAGNEINLGVAASHSITNNGDFLLVIRPVITVAGARFETPLATLRADLSTTVDAGTPSVVTRDLHYGFGGSSTIVLPAQPVATGGGQLDIECDLVLVYRQDIAEEFEIAVAGVQVLFQVTEYTSTGS